MWFMFVAALGIAIKSSAPPLTPAEAARILRDGPSMANFANRPSPLPDGPRVIIIDSSATSGPFGPFPTLGPQRPLNCCSSYSTPLPYPTVILKKEHR
jgi:hypothetical protein